MILMSPNFANKYINIFIEYLLVGSKSEKPNLN